MKTPLGSLGPFLLLATLIVACKAPERSEGTARSSVAATQGAAEPSAAPAGKDSATCGASAPSGTCGATQQEGDSLCSGATAGTDDSPRSYTDPSTGAQGLAVGAALTGAQPLSPADLTARATELRGQTVTVQGRVSAMCHHRRGWMALQSPDDRSGGWVRVITAPGFLVPADSVGKLARAEGVVQVVEVPDPSRQHLQQEHSLSSPSSQQVVLRATGAVLLP